VLTIGSLCSGYGGLDIAALKVLDGRVAWHADNDPAATRVLARHWPDVPNHGDITTADWSSAEPVDVLTAGYPCQPDSAAGLRKGTDDERWIWPAVRDAIRDLGPRLVVLENVRGHLGRGFPSVVGDLADIGYDCRWCCVPASAVGAPHRRERLFAVAHPHGSPVRQQPVAVTGRGGATGAGLDHRAPADSHGPGRAELAGSPPAAGWPGRDDAGRGGALAAADIPDGGLGRDVEARLMGYCAHAHESKARPSAALHHMRRTTGTQEIQRAPGRQRGLPASAELLAGMREHPDGRHRRYSALAGEASPEVGMRGLRSDPASPCPPCRSESREQRSGEPEDALFVLSPDIALARGSGQEDGGGTSSPCDCGCSVWGKYAPAIRRWEMVLGRSAPDPTELSPKGARRLSASLSEWMMGLPAGWVIDVPDLTRNDQLRLIGNGVIPQQAVAALQWLLDIDGGAA
jgi:DNA (cytosine-5)-methyltransferase 1